MDGISPSLNHRERMMCSRTATTGSQIESFAERSPLSSNCEQLSPVTERDTTSRRWPWFTWIFAAITLLGWFGGRFLMFLWPEASDWLITIGVVGMIIATLWLIVCAFLPKPLSAPILLATLVIIVAAGLIEDQSGGIVGLGFRIHASPMEQYLAACKNFERERDHARHQLLRKPDLR
jgi:hypothetical protein